MSAKEVKKLAEMATMQRRLRLLAEAAAIFFSVPLEQLRSPSKQPLYAWPRMVCQAIAVTRYKQPDVARYWRRDRSSMRYSLIRVKARMETEPAIKKEVDTFVTFVSRYIKKEEKDGGRFGKH
jgi:chromosomal replication initiation ATPase DnaA